MRMREVPPSLAPVLSSLPDGTICAGSEDHAGSVLVVGDEIYDWEAANASDIRPDSLVPVIGAEPSVDLLIVGTGLLRSRVPPVTEQALESAGIAIEVMATAPAIRAYNALLSDARVIAAALIREV